MDISSSIKYSSSNDILMGIFDNDEISFNKNTYCGYFFDEDIEKIKRDYHSLFETYFFQKDSDSDSDCEKYQYHKNKNDIITMSDYGIIANLPNTTQIEALKKLEERRLKQRLSYAKNREKILNLSKEKRLKKIKL
jgi:hypothetical protein